MTLLACIAIIFFGFAVYNLSCAIVDVPTKKTSRMMMLSRKQQGVKAENLLDVYVTKIAGMIAPYLRIDRLKRTSCSGYCHRRYGDDAGGVYRKSWVTAAGVGACALPMTLIMPLFVPILIGLCCGASGFPPIMQRLIL